MIGIHSIEYYFLRIRIKMIQIIVHHDTYFTSGIHVENLLKTRFTWKYIVYFQNDQFLKNIGFDFLGNPTNRVNDG